MAKVVLLFKKGDAALPENYRPISLLPIGYKILAALIHQRLISGGVDAMIRQAQYGFRARRNCNDALMVVRRIIDAAYEERHSGLMLLFLDWAKAFDRIKTPCLLLALRRFGLPVEFVEMIGSIYEARRFFIADHSGPSDIHNQNAGIAQGCPLSPFLFILVQSVMFHDIYNRLHLDPEPAFLVTREVLYADDTLLMSTSVRNLQTLLNEVVAEGAKYGLELNWDKTYQMQVCTATSISRPDGQQIMSKREVIYLGSIITCDGSCEREVSRRIGEGRSVFKILSKLWCHANLTIHRKLQISNACIVT